MEKISTKLARPIIIEFVTGPSAGKSTTSFGLAYKFKLAGVNIEYLPEYAKLLTWRGDFQSLSLQIHVTTEQIRGLYDLSRKENDLKVIISDTSMLLGIIYKYVWLDGVKYLGLGSGDLFDQWIKSIYSEFDIRTYYLKRDLSSHSYNEKGRTQSLEESLEYDERIYDMLIEHQIPFTELEYTGDTGVQALFETIMQDLKDSGKIK